MYIAKNEARLDNFLPVGSQQHFIVFQNDKILYCTPLQQSSTGRCEKVLLHSFLCSEWQRTFRAAFSTRRQDTKWETYTNQSIIHYIQDQIKNQSMSLGDYVEGNIRVAPEQSVAARRNGY